jgi:hypothetical protein
MEKTCGNCGLFNGGSLEDLTMECVDEHRKAYSECYHRASGCEHWCKREEDES